jgi:hypothetical protein
VYTDEAKKILALIKTQVSQMAFLTSVYEPVQAYGQTFYVCDVELAEQSNPNTATSRPEHIIEWLQNRADLANPNPINLNTVERGNWVSTIQINQQFSEVPI